MLVYSCFSKVTPNISTVITDICGRFLLSGFEVPKLWYGISGTTRVLDRITFAYAGSTCHYSTISPAGLICFPISVLLLLQTITVITFFFGIASWCNTKSVSILLSVFAPSKLLSLAFFNTFWCISIIYSFQVTSNISSRIYLHVAILFITSILKYHNRTNDLRISSSAPSTEE